MTLKDALLTDPNVFSSKINDFVMYTGRKGHQQINKILRRNHKVEVLKNKHFMDINGREVQIGDIVISAAYHNGFGVVMFKIIGETRTKWKVKAIKPDYITRDKIEKSNSLFITESGSN